MFGIPLLVNLFISLIELKNIHQKHQIIEHTCKFKIDKAAYSKLYSRTTMTLARASLSCILYNVFVIQFVVYNIKNQILRKTNQKLFECY